MQTLSRHPRLGLGVLLITVACVSFTYQPPTSHAEGTASNVHNIDLPKMTLPLSAFGPDYAGFELDPFSGFEPEDDRDAREVNAYFTSYFNPAEDEPLGSTSVGAAAGLFNSSGDAAGFISDAKSEFQNEFESEGGQYATFPALGIEGAVGFRGSFSLPDLDLFFEVTGVIFPLDRLVGEVAFIRFDDTNVQADAIAAAAALSDRMKGVLTGKITDFPAPLPPDPNCNGSLDAIDASLILQLDAGLVRSLACQALSDANQDGRTNAIDASLILQYGAGIIDSLPV